MSSRYRDEFISNRVCLALWIQTDNACRLSFFTHTQQTNRTNHFWLTITIFSIGRDDDVKLRKCLRLLSNLFVSGLRKQNSKVDVLLIKLFQNLCECFRGITPLQIGNSSLLGSSIRNDLAANRIAHDTGNADSASFDFRDRVRKRCPKFFRSEERQIGSQKTQSGITRFQMLGQQIAGVQTQLGNTHSKSDILQLSQSFEHGFKLDLSLRPGTS